MTTPLTPARLGFLAIYNPSLSPTLDDQILYYASPAALTTRRRARRRRRRAAQHGRPTEDLSPSERNERLRQIGLAQGMVGFAGGFASGSSVDSVETERSRVVVREIEGGWWVLASVDLTRVPLPPKLPTSASAPAQPEAVEYSSRELKPAALLVADLLRAHALFLLQHGASLSSLLPALGRRRFVSVLTRYWDLFLSTWSVALHGNPVRSVFGGINVAASGELGVGVGEEERGSGEREVLEGLVGRVEGLVDVVVSKFAEVAGEDGGERDGSSWMGAGRDPETEDGAVFLGVGALGRKSLTDLTHWVEDLYTWGDNAYGVIGAPSYTAEDAKGKKAQRKGSGAEPQAPDSKSSEDPTKRDQPVDEVPPSENAKEPSAEPRDAPGADPTQPEASEGPPQDEGNMDKFVNILKLGYGTYWSLGGADAPPAEGPRSKPPKRTADQSEGYFLLGLKGTVEEQPPSDSEDSSAPPPTQTRTLHVRLSGSDETTPLRAVVYVVKPFILTFIFRPATPSLSSDTLYRSLHYQLSPLRKSLLLSTAYRPRRPGESMYDLVFDPEANTTHSSIPNIPVGSGDAAPWSRAEAASAHAHLLALYAARRPRDVETTARTNKGWWIVWSRAPREAHPPISEEDSEGGGRGAEGRKCCFFGGRARRGRGRSAGRRWMEGWGRGWGLIRGGISRGC